MGFKLGSERGNYAVGGELKTNLRFGGESADPNISIPGTPIIRKPLEKDVLGEANMDGTIYISDQLQPGSPEERQVINHEMIHATDMKLGVLSYADDHIMYNGEKFERKDVNGVDSIYVDGEWKQAGDSGFPWENDANNGNHRNPFQK